MSPHIAKDEAERVVYINHRMEKLLRRATIEYFFTVAQVEQIMAEVPPSGQLLSLSIYLSIYLSICLPSLCLCVSLCVSVSGVIAVSCLREGGSAAGTLQPYH